MGADQGFRAPSWDQESVRDSGHEDSASARIAAGQRPRPSFRHPHGQLAVASVTWYELAWLALNGRIVPQRPVGSWLDDLARSLITVPLTPAIAVTACSLTGPFSGDPADRQIYATASNLGWTLVSKDRRLRDYAEGDVEVVW